MHFRVASVHGVPMQFLQVSYETRGYRKMKRSDVVSALQQLRWREHVVSVAGIMRLLGRIELVLMLSVLAVCCSFGCCQWTA